MADYRKAYEEWLTGEIFDEQTKQELTEISGNDKEIEDRFYKPLEFGTAGLRGIIGAGLNRMNIYTVGKATQGLANYIQKTAGEGTEPPSVAISFDSRKFSAEFARSSALILNANGIRAYIFDSLRPTPELSFAVRHLKCIAGIMITASHNPREYNGYKAYWADGAQISHPRDEEITSEVNAVSDFAEIKTMPFEEAKEKGLYVEVGAELDEEFLKNVMALRVNPEISLEHGKNLKVVYTPLNGAGNLLVRRVLSDCGFENVFIVPEQEMPDPDFTTVAYPNPEDLKVFELPEKLAAEKDADIIVATDPDSDRLGVAVKNCEGGYTALSGNMVGTLLAEYILGQRQENKTLPNDAAVVSTVVSTRLTKEIARHYNVKYYEVLTGFKFIAGKILEMETSGTGRYVYGFEESIGYLIGSFTRDKDAVTAAMLVCEMAIFYKMRGLTLLDGLNEIYEKYGYWHEGVKSIVLKGIEGIEEMKEIMARLRATPIKVLGGIKLNKIADYKTKIVHDLELDISYETGLPVSDVLHYTLSDESWFCVRPSGTEPKIKIYYGATGRTAGEAAERYGKLTADVTELIER